MKLLGCIPTSLRERNDMIRQYFEQFRTGFIKQDHTSNLVLSAKLTDLEIFETFTIDYPVPEKREEKPVDRNAVKRQNYGWEEDDDDLKYKEKEFVAPTPLSCDLTVVGSTGDEFVRADHMREWNRVTSGHTTINIRDSGGYSYLTMKENMEFLRSMIVGACFPERHDDESDSSIDDNLK
jgi:hypothetical protein